MAVLFWIVANRETQQPPWITITTGYGPGVLGRRRSPNWRESGP